MFTFYEVGGKIRDKYLGLENKDVDFTVVPNNKEQDISKVFQDLSLYLTQLGFKIFLETPACFTIRAKFPDNYKYSGVADFVLSRKEIKYNKDSRTPEVTIGTLFDDLQRRDCTVNAMAEDENGNLIDYFNGMEDLKHRIIRTPLNPIITIDDDPLRILRYLRFSITKSMTIEETLYEAIQCYDYNSRMYLVSNERIREELSKMFKENSLESFEMIAKISKLKEYLFKKVNIKFTPSL